MNSAKSAPPAALVHGNDLRSTPKYRKAGKRKYIVSNRKFVVTPRKSVIVRGRIRNTTS